nr:hypothetical protein [Tanacetum cinerariifolium]
MRWTKKNDGDHASCSQVILKVDQVVCKKDSIVEGSSSLYATGPILLRILNGPMYQGSSFPLFSNRMIPLRACKCCRICTIFSVVSWIISGPNLEVKWLSRSEMIDIGIP